MPGDSWRVGNTLPRLPESNVYLETLCAKSSATIKRMSFSRVPRLIAVVLLSLSGGYAQTTENEPAPVQDKRAFGLLPNYRTAELSEPFSPISVTEKFRIASKDSLDWPPYFAAAVFSGMAQLNNTHPSFGQGAKGYAHRYVTAAVDQAGGNLLTEAALPSLFRMDPRYFRKGTGSTAGRIGWALSRVAVARTNSGKWTFNSPEFLGNGMIAAMGNVYYPDSRGAGHTMERMFMQIGTDALSQLLKEFWPDVKKALERRKHRSTAPVK